MNRALLIILLLFVGNSFSAQQVMFNSQYMLNQYVINPAAAGQKLEAPLALSVRQQWAGLNGAPVTQHLSFNSKFGKKSNMAMGTQLFNDVNGAFQNMGIQGSYAYHIKTSVSTKLSIGVSAILSQTTVDGTDFIMNDYSDETLLGTKQSSFNPDVSAGIFYFSNNFFIGASAIQLLQSKYTFGENIVQNQQVNHVYGSGGLTIRVGPGYKIEPSFMVKSVGNVPLQYDLNARLFYRENVWVGFSYRNVDAAIVMVGLERDRFLIGYAHDFTMSDLSNHSVGSNEIYLQYSFKSKKKGATKF